MSKQLETLVNEYISIHQDKLSLTEEESFYEEACNALKATLIKDVTQEIISEQADIISKMADDEMERLKTEKHVKELRRLLWEGFIVAFFVGLLVNQATDLISIFKGVIESTFLLKTIIFISLFIVICVFIFIFNYLVKLVDFLR